MADAPAPPLRPPAPDRRNHLTLVERQYYLQTANLHPTVFEAIVYLYTEADYLEDGFTRAYLDNYLVMSCSVDSRRADQLVQAMMGDVHPAKINASDLRPPLPPDTDAPIKKGVKRFGLLR